MGRRRAVPVLPSPCVSTRRDCYPYPRAVPHQRCVNPPTVIRPIRCHRRQRTLHRCHEWLDDRAVVNPRLGHLHCHHPTARAVHCQVNRAPSAPLIPIAQAEFTIALLLQVPPASRGEPRAGSVPPARRGNLKEGGLQSRLFCKLCPRDWYQEGARGVREIAVPSPPAPLPRSGREEPRVPPLPACGRGGQGG
jgi:hypothetical protein